MVQAIKAALPTDAERERIEQEYAMGKRTAAAYRDGYERGAEDARGEQFGTLLCGIVIGVIGSSVMYAVIHFFPIP